MMPQTTPPPVGLCVQDLTVRYGTAAVLQGVSFSVPVSGQLIGLLGVNGSGKTTLLKAAAGLLPHTGQCPRHTGRALGIVAHAAAAEHHGVQAFFHDFSSQTVDHRILSVKTRRPAGRLWYAVRWGPPPGGYSG